MKITLKAYAKINLLLDIITKYQNGYHGIFTIMQSVSLYDKVTVEKTETGKITITCDKDFVPLNESNIAYKAAKSFFDYTGITNEGLHIHIEKNIPHGAGLAGGSADGAAVINGLCELYRKELTYRDKVKIAVKVGADVPFCVFGSTVLCQNIGDVMSFLPEIPNCFIVLCKPEQAVKTEGAYISYDNYTARIRHPDNMGMVQAIIDNDLDDVSRKCENVFEQVIEVCDRASIKSVMRKHGATASVMSGSGAAIYGIFKSESEAVSACNELKKNIPDTFITVPLNRGTEIICSDC